MTLHRSPPIVQPPTRSTSGVVQGRFVGVGPRLTSFMSNGGTGISIQRKGGTSEWSLPPGFLCGNDRGRPLPDGVRTKMESFFGANFADVRVHVGPEASSIGALAFTTGSNLYFALGQYNPDSVQGQALLGHELAHVVQQRQGRVSGPRNGGMVVVQDSTLEAEADRLGQRAAMHRPPVVANVPSGMQRASIQMRPAVQRAAVRKAKLADFSSSDEDNKDLLAIAAGITGDQKTVEGKVFDTIDLSNRSLDIESRSLFQGLYDAFDNTHINEKNGPIHNNDENKLPTALLPATGKDGTPMRYFELYFFGGGMRLVVDLKDWTSYVSAHYGKFYIIHDRGQNPLNRNIKILTHIRAYAAAIRSGNWKNYENYQNWASTQ